MKLTEFDNKKISISAKALNENYSVPFKTGKMNMTETKSMLNKVRSLISETQSAADFYQKQTSPSYMKLVFMEQALADRFNQLRSMPQPRIVVENEEVEKSQVVLAAQDMVDTVQKMVEQVSDMLVKELPALSDSVQSEIGVNEGEQFTSQATEALTSLTGALSQAKATLQGALNSITGQGGAGAFDAGMGGDDMGADMGADLGGDMDTDMGDEEDFSMDVEDDVSVEEPEEEMPVAGAGRAKR